MKTPERIFVFSAGVSFLNGVKESNYIELLSSWLIVTHIWLVD